MEQIILPEVWLLPVSMLIPIVIAAATHPSAPSSTRQGLALFAAIGVALLEQITGSNGFTVEGLVVAATLAFLTQLGTYLGTNQIVDINNRIAPTAGVGKV